MGILDLVQVFVESLDKCFENVCELDLIFHSDKIHYILDEVIMAGMVLETNINNIIVSITDQTKLNTASLKATTTASQVPPKDGSGKLFSSISSAIGTSGGSGKR